jgi:PleD family two-component response regulator
MFTVKILDAAKQAGLEPVFVKTEGDALRLARETPALIILDLNSNAFEPLRLIERLKSDAATHDITLLGFVSHVQADLKLAAEERGCNLVMPRSAFSHNLPAILAKYAAIPK